MTYIVACTVCGMTLSRTRRDLNAVCQPCARAKNRDHVRARRLAMAAERTRGRKRCWGCGTDLPLLVARNQRYCDGCAAERLRESRRQASQRMRAKRSRLPNPNDTPAGGICARARADGAICRGKCKRRCTACGQLYQLTGIETPCPNCQDHLIDNPLEVSRVA